MSTTDAGSRRCGRPSSLPCALSVSTCTTSSCSAAPRARTLRVTVTGTAGVDLEAITAVTRAVSPLVDARPTRSPGSYLLEVSSPGIERTLRRPEHFSGALGEEVSIKFRTEAGPRRVRGVLVSVDSTTTTCVVETDDGRRATNRVRRHHAGAHRLRVGSAAASRQGRSAKAHAAGGEEGGEAMKKPRDARSAVGARSRKGHLRRRHARSARERARHRVQAHARRGRGSPRRDRRRDRRDPRDRAGARRRGQRHARVGRHSRRLRSHRRADGEAGHPAAHSRGRARDEVRGVRRAAKATSSPASSSRPTPATRCSTWAGSRRCCRRPSRSRATATTTARA